MSNSPKSLSVPDGWADVVVRTLTALLVAFVTLTVKEWMETRELDMPACAIDAGCIAAGTFLLYAILWVSSGSARRVAEKRPVHVGH